jgi:PAP2 superfamily
MWNLELSWQQAATVAGVLAVATVGLRLARRPRLAATATFTQETALVLALFALWQFAGSFAVMGPDGALARGRWLWHLERVLHLPSETAVQQLFLPHPLIVQGFNLYYDGLHFPVLIACLIWLFVRHRDRYSPLRVTLVALTGACLLIQLIPVAPPRMLPGTGMVDTAVLYHQSVYATHAGFEPDQLSAMPSVHVGWAILVAIMVISAARSRWRWLALLYPALTTLAVVVTANHYWMDGIVAGLILAAVLLIQTGVTRVLARFARRPNAVLDHDEVQSPQLTR